MFPCRAPADARRRGPTVSSGGWISVALSSALWENRLIKEDCSNAESQAPPLPHSVAHSSF